MPTLGMSPIAVVEVNDSAAQALMAGVLALFFRNSILTELEST
uniref:Uncharacterized protein n=1 Tax=Candidatus Nitrotoga fabula TaxID=2182327 RepID=A0A2X0QYY4_9PROT|nr:protein of unknown function [Candidatus Nitrotoga fabula]